MRLIEVQRPPRDDLLAMYLSVVTDLNNNIMKNADFHSSQHATARKLVISYPDLLMTPTAELSQLLVVSKRDILESEMFKKLINDAGLKIIRQMEVADWMFEACFRFSLVSRLAPEWNRVGSSLIQGTEFLNKMCKRKYRRIGIDVHCNSNGQLYMKLMPDVVKMYPLELWELGLEKEMRLQSCQLRLPGASRQPKYSRWCQLLPKLSRGQVVGIRDNLPSDSAVDSYGGLRDYWWKSYGYSLPEKPPRFYYDIYYRMIGTQLFTYPNYCVLSGEPASVNVDQRQLDLSLYAFVQVLTRKMSSVCGMETKLKLIQYEHPSRALTPASFKRPLIQTPQDLADENSDPKRRRL